MVQNIDESRKELHRSGFDSGIFLNHTASGDTMMFTTFGDSALFDCVDDILYDLLVKTQVDLSLLYRPVSIASFIVCDKENNKHKDASLLHAATAFTYYMLASRACQSCRAYMSLFEQAEPEIQEFFEAHGLYDNLDAYDELYKFEMEHAAEELSEAPDFAVFAENGNVDGNIEIISSFDNQNRHEEMVSSAYPTANLMLTSMMGKRLDNHGYDISDIRRYSPSVSLAGDIYDGKSNQDGIDLDGHRGIVANVGSYFEFLENTTENCVVDVESGNESCCMHLSILPSRFDFVDSRVDTAYLMSGISCDEYRRPAKMIVLLDASSHTPGEKVGMMRTISCCAFYDMALRALSQYIEDLDLLSKNPDNVSIMPELYDNARAFGYVYESELAQTYRELPRDVNFSVIVVPADEGLGFSLSAIPGGKMVPVKNECAICQLNGDAAYMNQNAPVLLPVNNDSIVFDIDADAEILGIGSSEQLIPNNEEKKVPQSLDFAIEIEAAKTMGDFITSKIVKNGNAVFDKARDSIMMKEAVDVQYDRYATEHYGMYDGGKTAICVVDIKPGLSECVDKTLSSLIADNVTAFDMFRRHRRIISIATVDENGTYDEAVKAAHSAAKTLFYGEERRTAQLYRMALECMEQTPEVRQKILECVSYEALSTSVALDESQHIEDTTMFMATDQRHCDSRKYTVLSGDDLISAVPPEAAEAIYLDLVRSYLLSDGDDVVFVGNEGSDNISPDTATA